jgi:hypothetical protein
LPYLHYVFPENNNPISVAGYFEVMNERIEATEQKSVAGFVDFDEAVLQFRVVVAVKRGYSEPFPYRFEGHSLAERDRLGCIVDHAQGDLLSGCGPGCETEDGEK